MKTLLLNLFCFAFILNAAAHDPSKGKDKFFKPRKPQAPAIIIGLSGVVIDDDGQRFKNLFNVKDSWNSVYAPTRATIESPMFMGWSAELSVAYSRLKAGKIEDDFNHLRKKDVNLYAVDINAKYYPIQALSKLLSPYGIVGLGYTNRAFNISANNGVMANVGLGVSVWIFKGLGVNVQSMAKFAINANSSNYLMHSLGVVYRFRP